MSDWTLEDIVAVLCTEDSAMLEALPRSRCGRTHKAKTKEWPPRCPSDACDMRKGCICHARTSVAADYFDCVQQIYGDSARGMPEERPGSLVFGPAPLPKLAPLPTVPGSETPKPSRKRRLPTPPPVSADNGLVLYGAEIDAPMRLYEFFADACENDPGNQVDNSHVTTTIDLYCHETSFEGKRVTWSGLPPNPPVWRAGIPRKVPRRWTPCKHVRVIRDTFPLIPETAGLVTTVAVAPGVCWT